MTIKASDEALVGKYSNTMQVMHTKDEFVLDFLSVFPPAGHLVSRVIVSPGQMKQIAKALAENIEKYEANFGTVTPSDTPKTSIGFQSKD